VSTRVADNVFHGTALKVGEKIMALFESQFRRATVRHTGAFDISRCPNSNLAFGSGTYFCIAHLLARMEVELASLRLLQRLPDLQLASPEDLPLRAANFISGLEPCRWCSTPTAPLAG